MSALHRRSPKSKSLGSKIVLKGLLIASPNNKHPQATHRTVYGSQYVRALLYGKFVVRCRELVITSGKCLCLARDKGIRTAV